ncbi:MAG: hypothetical protein PVG45_12200 [Gammaproteobacteria bacterium]
MQAADIGGGPAALLRFMDTALERTMRSKSGPLAALLSGWLLMYLWETRHHERCG